MTTRIAERRRPNWRRNATRGQSLVELALVIPVMLSLFVGVYAASGYISDRQVAGQAARAGARLGAEIGSNTGAPLAACQAGNPDDPCSIDNEIIQQMETIGKGLVETATIDEIDIYQPCSSGCSTTDQTCSGPDVPGTYSPSLTVKDVYTRDGTLNPDGTPHLRLQGTAAYLMSLRQQKHPSEAAIAVRFLYTYQAPVPLFTFFNRQSSEYATMCFSPKF